MSKVKTIENTYHDVLYWATSPKSKGTKYHLTQREDAVLRKLIHYHSNKKYITYSNEVISEHTYISVEHLKKIIPKLIKKGYINSSDFTSSNDGIFFTKRTITINWDVIEEALNALPQKKAILEKEKETVVPEETTTNKVSSEPIRHEVVTEPSTPEENVCVQSKDVENDTNPQPTSEPKQLSFEDVMKRINENTVSRQNNISINRKLIHIENVCTKDYIYEELNKDLKNGTYYKFIPVLVDYGNGKKIEDEAYEYSKNRYVIKSKALAPIND